MSLPHDLLATIPSRAAEAIHRALPDLRECAAMVGGFDVEELKRQSIAAPAVRVSLLAIRPLAAEAGPRRRWSASLAAFVITRDRMGIDRDTGALIITQALLGLVPENNWAIPGVGPAERVEARVIVGRGAREITTHLSAITWSQALVLDDLPAGGTVPGQLYVGGEPL